MFNILFASFSEDDADYLSETVGKWFKEVRIVDCSENDIFNEI